MSPPMHEDEFGIDARLVRRLLAAQFPEWEELPLEPVHSAGTVHAIYRLGQEMSVRLPRVARGVGDVERDHRWLPTLAPRLPLDVAVPLARGEPADGYPWPWSVCRWVKGQSADVARPADMAASARALAQFLGALRRIDPTGGSPGWRSGPLAGRDGDVRASIAALRGTLDTAALSAAWEAALEAPPWGGPPMWSHGDLLPGNLVVRRGRLSGVIDFGCAGVGDPACDAMAAWTFFSGPSREVFRAALSPDEATWARGRGWALSLAVIALPYYERRSPAFAGLARHIIDEVLSDLRP